LIVCHNPVPCDCLLRLYKRYLSRTNKTLKFRFDNVFYARTAPSGISFWPQVFAIGWMASKLKANEVIFFIVAQSFIGITVLGDLLLFQSVCVASARANFFSSSRTCRLFF
jgi:hypothetical protein